MPTPDDILKKADAINEAYRASRQTAMEALAPIVAERHQIQLAFGATRAPYIEAYANALAAGWTEQELNDLGAEDPGARPKGRPRKSRASSPKKAAKATPEAITTPQTPAAPATESTAANDPQTPATPVTETPAPQTARPATENPQIPPPASAENPLLKTAPTATEANSI